MKSPSIFLFIGVIFGIAIWSSEGRHYRHSSAELALTNEVLIDQADCNQETPIFIHSGATSSGTYYERRMVIRRTWAREAAANQMRVIFIIGESRGSASEEAKLKAESNKYNDMLQFGFKVWYI